MARIDQHIHIWPATVRVTLPDTTTASWIRIPLLPHSPPMYSPTLPVLRQLHRLNKSSSGFHDRLRTVLYGEEYRQCAPELQGDDLVWIIDYLDEALDCLPPSSTGFRKCLLELKFICGRGGTLPKSYALSPSRLNTGPLPSASGGFGDVYEGTLDGATVCIKRVRVYSKNDPEEGSKIFCKEAIMWKHLSHPNIVPLLGVTIIPFQLISSWMTGGTLLEYIKTNPNADRLGLVSDVAKGLHYLHSCNVIHADLKGPNVLVDDCGNARIADFGLARVTRNPDSMRISSEQASHTPRWTAPEILNGRSHSREADIFSFAMVMIEAFTGAVPFKDLSAPVAMVTVMQGDRPLRPEYPTFTENLWTLMKRCWDQDPRLRPNISQVLQVLPTPKYPAWKRLISHALPADEHTSLITAAFSDDDQVEMVEHLSGDDAQTFIDRIGEALDSLAPEIRGRCLRYLYGICGRHTLLPRHLTIPFCCDLTEHPLRHGGSANVWVGQHRNQEVAVKVMRVYSTCDFGQAKRRFCREVVAWRALCHPNVLPLLGVTMTGSQFVAVSEWMAKGNISEFVKADVNADRLGLLEDVTMGLMYVHGQGMVHGNLSGANILIDNVGHARLSGFGLLAIVSDRSAIPSSVITGSPVRWMSPELLSPEKFGLKGGHPTKESDCYSLGMVIYEVLSDLIPYSLYNHITVVQKILDGERPAKPGGAKGEWFTGGLWETLGLCWKPKPNDRPTLRAVLRCLEDGTRPSHTSLDVGRDMNAKSDATASLDHQ